MHGLLVPLQIELVSEVYMSKLRYEPDKGVSNER